MSEVNLCFKVVIKLLFNYTITENGAGLRQTDTPTKKQIISFKAFELF